METAKIFPRIKSEFSEFFEDLKDVFWDTD